MTRTRVMIAILAAVAPLALTSCDLGGHDSRARNAAATTPPPTLALTPAGNATKQPASTEIGTTVRGGKVTDVAVTVDGKKVTGAMRPDGSSWVPDRPLSYGKSYTARVTAKGPTGQTTTRTTTFHTMPAAGPSIESGLSLLDGEEYGMAMPVPVEFRPGIPEQDRAKVQRRLFVRTDPPQEGTWRWLADGSQALYRAPKYWKAGTRISVRIALEGIPLSNGQYGDADRLGSARIGAGRLEMKVDNVTKRMTVLRDGKKVRSMPVSLGKPSTPSSSGTMVVMEKAAQTVFDTRTDPDPANRYRVDIEYAQRLTWGGEFIHAAPWSEYDQGERNVSHGCVNVSTANAKWLFDHTRVGDPVTITGTGTQLADGNGWTAWNLPWEEFVKGSALPVPPALRPSPAPSAPGPAASSAASSAAPSGPATRGTGPAGTRSPAPSGSATASDPADRGTRGGTPSATGAESPATGRRDSPSGGTSSGAPRSGDRSPGGSPHSPTDGNPTPAPRSTG